MKRIVPLLCVVTASIVALSRPINVPTQPVSPYADTEVSTNIVIHPSRTDVRDVKLHSDELYCNVRGRDGVRRFLHSAPSVLALQERLEVDARSPARCRRAKRVGPM